MDLELNDKEIEALEVLLETRIAAIGPEIHHTDTPSYRAMAHSVLESGATKAMRVCPR